MTSNDLWPPWKTIGIIYPPRATNIPSLKLRQLSLVEIPCLQGFQSLTSGDLKWPLTSIKTKGIIYLPRATNIPSLKFRQLSLIEISCLQASVTHAHTHTHTYTHTRHHHRIDSFSLRQGIKNRINIWVDRYITIFTNTPAAFIWKTRGQSTELHISSPAHWNIKIFLAKQKSRFPWYKTPFFIC